MPSGPGAYMKYKSTRVEKSSVRAGSDGEQRVGSVAVELTSRGAMRWQAAARDVQHEQQ